jgi:hypothetical protein
MPLGRRGIVHHGLSLDHHFGLSDRLCLGTTQDTDHRNTHNQQQNALFHDPSFWPAGIFPRRAGAFAAYPTLSSLSRGLVTVFFLDLEDDGGVCRVGIVRYSIDSSQPQDHN